MEKFLHLLIIFCLISPSNIHAETHAPNIKIAFIREGHVWIKVDGEEEKLTAEKAIYNYAPLWSFDGSRLLYEKEVTRLINEEKKTQNEIWVYEIESKKHHKIFYDGQNPTWSPTENIIAFQQGSGLNISDLTSFYNITFGVDDYAWQPDGKGFIVSSSASLRPDGWTSPILYTISLEEGYQHIPDFTKYVKKLFVIPKEVGKDDVKILSISTEQFAYSPNKQWISFIISPTASWSMDSDMLAIISVDGKEFEVIDEVILEFTPKWAFTKNLLGYIAGGGRIVFGFKNKDLKVTELPTYNTDNLTPKNYAEMGFSWVNDTSLIVSRVPESEWFNEAKKRPKPSLYFLTLTGQKQRKITTPIKGKGDYNPVFLASLNKITWLRKGDLVDTKGDLWAAKPNGNDAKVWVYDIELYSFFPF